MPATPDLATLLTIARYTLLGYATAATALTTACLVLHALSVVHRRGRYRHGGHGGHGGHDTLARSHRPVFVPLGAEHE